jgi:hypothetical protein
MLSMTDRRGLYLLPDGLALASTDVRAFRVAMMPALATDTVCCSITCTRKGVKVRRRGIELLKTRVVSKVNGIGESRFIAEEMLNSPLHLKSPVLP